MGKKVLLIGGGIGQLHLAKKLHERNVELIIVAYHLMEEIRPFANKIIEHDLFDLKGVLTIAEEEKVEAVISDQHDLFVPTVAYVAEHLGLPGNTYNQAITYCDKNRFRDTCENCGVPVPKHVKVTDTITIPKDFTFPVMVKPADSQSSVGISKVNKESDYPKALTNAIINSRSGSAIVEDYFFGREIVSEGLIYKGKYYNLALADRRYFDLPNKFIPSQTLFPATVPTHLLNSISKYESRIAETVNPEFAIVHTEWLWNEEQNKLSCVESALRGGGVFISSHIIPQATGLDINELLIDFALGYEIDICGFLSKKKDMAAGYICFYLPHGVIKQVQGIEEVKSLDCVSLACINNVSIGDHTLEMTHKGQRLGPIIIHAKNRDNLEDCIKLCQQSLKIEVLDNTGIVKGAIWQ